MPDPFQFSTALVLPESTGIRVVSIAQLLKRLRVMPDAVIYHHTHHFLREHQYLKPEPSNDFAYWVTEIMGERELGERLASIDTIRFSNLAALRNRLVEVIDQYDQAHPGFRPRVVSVDEAFYFIKAISVVLRTPYQARTLQEFADALQAVTIDSLYFHIFEARLRLQQGPNDFSRWLEGIGESRLAAAVASLDPYTHTLEELRQTILRLVRERLAVSAPIPPHAVDS